MGTLAYRSTNRTKTLLQWRASPAMEGSQGLGVESGLRPEGVQEELGREGREGGAGGKTVAGGEANKSPGTEREERGDRGEMVNHWRERTRT